MPFPNIVTNEPVGTQMVSTIDDFERETRTWLKQCMQSISGYPEVDTVGVKGWTNNTRPKRNPNSNYLLGYNTDTHSLELVNASGLTIELLSNETKKSIALLAHPVGTYYWTSNTSFNPLTEWGGTWVKLQDGRCLISNCSTKSWITAKTVGETGGSEKADLEIKNLPPHEHKHTHKHRHDKGDYNITGYFGADDKMVNELSGAFSNGGWGYDTGATQSETGNRIKFNAKDAWTGNSGYDETPASKHQTGGGIPHDNMPPYRVAICWYRTA